MRRISDVVLGKTERRFLALLLLLVLALDFADRTLIGALGPVLKSEFHISNAQLGLLVTAVGVVAGIATLPIGMLTDRVNRTRMLALSFVVWIVAEIFTGAAVSFAMLFVARVFLGAIAATSGPTVPSLVGDVSPAGARGRTLGNIESGQLFGGAIGLALPVVILTFASWRWNFWVLAVAGAGMALALWRVGEPQRTGAAGPAQGEEGAAINRVQEIVQRKQVRPTQRAVLTQDPGEMNMWEATRYVLHVPTDVIVIIARAFGDFFFMAIGVFAVVFATQWYNLGVRQANIVFLIIGVGALVGVLVMGRVSDMLLRREWLNSRVWLGAVGYILAPVALYFAFLTHDLAIAMPLFALGAFLLVGANPPLDAVRIDVLVPRMRGRGEAIRQALRTFAEASAPLIVGLLSDHIAGGGAKGLQVAFLIFLPSLLVSGLVMLCAVRTYGPDVAAALESSRQRPEPETEQAHA